MSKTRLMLGDCLERMKEIDSGSVDMVLTDPPYGTIAAKWDKIIPFNKLWLELKRITKPNAAVLLFGSQPFTSLLACSNIDDFRYCWIWDKIVPSGFNYARYQPMRQHEDILVFYRERPSYDPLGEPLLKPKRQSKCGRKSEASNMDTRTDWVPPIETHKRKRSILRFGKIRRGGQHPTQKPVDLIEYLMTAYTKKSETVLDFTMGSGTTGIACLNTGRNFIGIEKDEHYFNLANKRIADHKIINE